MKYYLIYHFFSFKTEFIDIFRILIDTKYCKMTIFIFCCCFFYFQLVGFPSFFIFMKNTEFQYLYAQKFKCVYSYALSDNYRKIYIASSLRGQRTSYIYLRGQRTFRDISSKMYVTQRLFFILVKIFTAKISGVYLFIYFNSKHRQHIPSGRSWLRVVSQKRNTRQGMQLVYSNLRI